MAEVIVTASAPAAIGTYSQAVKVGDTVYISGQIPLEPSTMTLHAGTFRQQVDQVFANLSAVAEAAGGGLADIVKLTIYIVSMDDFAIINEQMAAIWPEPYPARAVVAVAALPKGAAVEMDAVMVLSS